MFLLSALFLLVTAMLQLLLTVGLISVMTSISAQTISDFRWQNRIVIIKATVAEQNHIVNQLENQQAEINDRDIIWLLLPARQSNRSLADAIYEEAQSYLDSHVILIGKDGGVKQRQLELDLQALFKAIDRMPMRQRELKQSSTVNPQQISD